MTASLLHRYLVDRAPGKTAFGTTQLVIVVLTGEDGIDRAFAMSKADAAIIAQKLMAAAAEAQGITLA